MSALEEETLLELTECESLDRILVISLRKRGYTKFMKTLANCENLKIAFLEFNEPSLEELKFLAYFHNLVKLDLSNCKINVLPRESTFKLLSNLKILYLHSNCITKYEDIKGVESIPNLLHITLYENKISKY